MEPKDFGFEGMEMYFPEGILPTVTNLKEEKLPQIHQINSALKSSPHVVGLNTAGYSPSVQTPSEKYGSRTKAGDVIFRYKCKDSSYLECGRENSTIWKVDLTPSTSEFVQEDYKYMFQKLNEVAEALDIMVEDTGSTIFLDLNNSDSRGSLKETFVEESLYLGRIRSDGGKLTSGSVYFEGCLDYSDGHTVSLDLSAVDEYHVFPGQIAVMEGKNELGKCLRVCKIHVPKPLPFTEIKMDKKFDPLNIIVAAGPYTPGDSLLYEPFKDLIKVIGQDKPDICILLGPFVEASHKLIETGESSETFEEIFQNLIHSLRDAVEEMRTQIVIVPSFKDVNGQTVYPTPPYSLNRSGKVTVVPDPALISAGGIIIGMTSTDVLMHLGRNELAKSTISGDRLGRLARHILSQRNFYPLYPSDESVPIDVEHCIRYGKINLRPHILILPSDLKHFIKDVEGTIVVNPERLTKGSSGGTFARIQVDLSSTQNESFSSIADYCFGEIVKI